MNVCTKSHQNLSIIKHILVWNKLGLHDISFRHQHRDVHMRNGDIAGRAMSSREQCFPLVRKMSGCLQSHILMHCGLDF